MACPGSVNLSKGKPNYTNPAAERGTKIHALLAAALTVNDSALIALSGLPEEDRELCMQAWHQIRNWIEETDEVLAEVQLDFEHYGMKRTGRDGEHQADVVILTKNKKGTGYSHAFVIDLKTGKHAVPDPIHNDQLYAYALGVKEKFSPRKITVGICQPTLYSEVRYYTIAQGKLNEFKKKLKALPALVESGDMLAEGDWCKYCKGAPDCPIKMGKQAAKKALGAEIKALVTGSNGVSVKADITGDLVVINAETVAVAETLAKEAMGLAVTSATADKAGELLNTITKLEKAVDKQRAEIKRPVLDLGKAIDAEAKKALEPLREGKANLKTGIEALEVKPEAVKETPRTGWKITEPLNVPQAYLTYDVAKITADVAAEIITGEETWIELTQSKTVSAK